MNTTVCSWVKNSPTVVCSTYKAASAFTIIVTVTPTVSTGLQGCATWPCICRPITFSIRWWCIWNQTNISLLSYQLSLMYLKSNWFWQKYTIFHNFEEKHVQSNLDVDTKLLMFQMESRTCNRRIWIKVNQNFISWSRGVTALLLPI